MSVRKLLIMLSICLLLCGCSKLPETYQYPNPLEEIVHVELTQYQSEIPLNPKPEFFCLLKELDVQEIQSFMNEVYLLPTEKVGTPPPMLDYGDYIAVVTYKNGDIELLGTSNIQYTEAGKIPTGVGSYHFVGDSFEELFLKYVDIED
jgi:hypothetical protein